LNFSTILGMVGGVTLVTWTIAHTTQDATIYADWPGLLLVTGGTFAATLMSFPLSEVLRVFRVFVIVLKNERLYAEQDIEEIVQVANKYYSGQLLQAEREIDKIKSPFLRIGIQLVVDGTPLDDILDLLQWRIARLKAKERSEAQVFRTMGTYSPAFGMVGTLLGLVNMLHAMGQGTFKEVGANMATALIATFYGILLANLIFKPIAAKLEGRTEQRVVVLNMVMQGIYLLSQKRSPTYIRETLNSFMAQHQDELRLGKAKKRRGDAAKTVRPAQAR
jgi:chemotaxis protein MotA